MNSQERLEFCKICTKRKFDRQRGIVCGLTDEKATFTIECVDFDLDKEQNRKNEHYEDKVGRADSKTVDVSLRLVNYLIDRFLLVILMLSVVFLIDFLAPHFLRNMSKVTNYIIVYVVYLAYFIICESLFQQTVGKLLTGTKVVDMKGGKPELNTIIGRSLLRIIPFDQFSFLGANSVGWHDSFSNTRVVSLNDFKDDDVLDKEFT